MTSWDAASVIKWVEMAALPKDEHGALLPSIRKAFEALDMCENHSSAKLLRVTMLIPSNGRAALICVRSP